MSESIAKRPVKNFEYFLEKFMREHDDIINDPEVSEEFRDSAKATMLDLIVLKKCYYEEKEKNQ